MKKTGLVIMAVGMLPGLLRILATIAGSVLELANISSDENATKELLSAIFGVAFGFVAVALGSLPGLVVRLLAKG